MPKVMVVDDEVVITMQLEQRLTAMGYEVVGTAASGDDAREMAKGIRPDLILMDIVMPGNLDGIAAAEIIKTETDIPVIFLTAYTEENLIQRAKYVEPLGYIVKPFEERELKAAIEVALYKKQIERRLQQSEQHFRLLYERVPLAYQSLDEEGHLIEVNHAWIGVLGYSHEQVIGKWFGDFLAPGYQDHFRKNFRRFKAAGEIWDAEFHMVRKDGSHICVSLNGKIGYDEKGNFKQTHCILHDVTERKRVEQEKKVLEAQLQRAQKMEAIGTLAGGIAHKFNNLLTAVQWNASLMLCDLDYTNPHHEMLMYIEKQVKSGAKLTRQLLGYARKGRYDVKPLNLNQLVEDIPDMFGRTKRAITIHRDLAEDLLGIEADEGQIEQVLLNMCVNAADAMPRGGTLSLKTMNVTHKDMQGKLYDPKPGNYVVLKVTDTGSGMDKETTDRIFDPFFTTKEMGRGTGLGLASTYGIIKAHGGYIDVESEKGRGTTFSIYLPATEKKVEKTVNIVERVIEGSRTILLVDAEPMILDMGVKVLKRLGYTVLEARGGKEAVEIYKTKKDKIDLVILDMIMPDMGGREAYDKMKEINPNIKVLLSSAYSIDGQAAEILARGCDAFIQKPFGMAEVSQTIKEVLGKE